MNTKSIYGLIGRPLGHSFSRDFFTRKFESEHIEAEYLNFELPDITCVTEMLDSQLNLKGFNVTIPYKQKIIPYLDCMNEIAAGVGAVNVVKVDVDEAGRRRLSGFNSDVIGFMESIRPLLPQEGTNALVLGTGGASRAVIYALRQLGYSVTLVSRTPGTGVITYGDITHDIMRQNRVIVNTTPVGMYPAVDKCPDIPYDDLTPGHLCYDLVYNPAETLFMKKAAEHGANVKNGLEMLHLQALAAWDIWNNRL